MWISGPETENGWVLAAPVADPTERYTARSSFPPYRYR